jgi:hypothetical protein
MFGDRGQHPLPETVRAARHDAPLERLRLLQRQLPVRAAQADPPILGLSGNPALRAAQAPAPPPLGVLLFPLKHEQEICGVPDGRRAAEVRAAMPTMDQQDNGGSALGQASSPR